MFNFLIFTVMDNNSISINPASVADSTSVQEQVVKGSLSSSNLNECEGCLFEGDEFDLENYKYDYRTGHPAVYVGTYHKYNCGSLFGAWLDLTTFASYEDFCEVCRFLHRDEADPELMFQDMENFPDEWYSESGLDEDTFDLILQYADLDDDERRAFDAYIENKGSGRDAEVFDDFRDKYVGEFDSEEEFAEHIADECGMLDKVPESIKQYFNYERFARDLFASDYDFFDNAFVFRAY